MCDYSLMSVDNRLAVCGEELMVHRFEIFSRGLASVADVEAVKRAEQPPRSFLEKVKRTLFPADPPQCPAVCIPPGARLLLRDIPERMRHDLNLDSAEQEVVFTQIDTTGYRDAVRFANGAVVLLQRLSERQRVRVLALSSEPDEEILADEGEVIRHAAIARS